MLIKHCKVYLIVIHHEVGSCGSERDEIIECESEDDVLSELESLQNEYSGTLRQYEYSVYRVTKMRVTD